MSEEVLFPPEVVDLPSKGWFYSENSPLASGQIELYHMTAKHEDILTSRNLITKGIVIDKLMEALVASKDVKYDDILIGDKNGIMVAARILGYGKDYEVTVTCPMCDSDQAVVVDLENIENKEVEQPPVKGKNEFDFILPVSKKTVTFKLLTHKDEREVSQELDKIQKATRSDVTHEVTYRMKRSIVAVDGDRTRAAVSQLVDNMLVRDAQALREHIRKISPDVELSFDFICNTCSHREEKMEIPIDVNFFWPNVKV